MFPSGPGGTATNTTGVALNSTHIYLSWDHPPEDLHHGVIRYYQLNITEQDTGRTFQLTSEDTEITIGPLHPHYIYHCVVSAVTVDEGPYITITVRTDEDGTHSTVYRIGNIMYLLILPFMQPRLVPQQTFEWEQILQDHSFCHGAVLFHITRMALFGCTLSL